VRSREPRSCSFTSVEFELARAGVVVCDVSRARADELTIARAKPDALFLCACVVGIGLGLRAYAQRRAGLRTITVSEHLAASVAPETPRTSGSISAPASPFSSARGLTPVLRLRWRRRASGRHALLLYVKELAVTLPARWKAPSACAGRTTGKPRTSLTNMLEQGRQNQVQVIPLYSVSENPAATILDLSATAGYRHPHVGAASPHARAMFKGDVANQVAKTAENIPIGHPR